MVEWQRRKGGGVWGSKRFIRFQLIARFGFRCLAFVYLCTRREGEGGGRASIMLAHIRIFLFMRVCACLGTNTYIHTYLHTHIPTYTHTCIHTYLHTHIPTYTHTYIHTYLHTHIPTYTHTCIHTYLHIDIRIRIHAYTHACKLADVTYIRARIRT